MAGQHAKSPAGKGAKLAAAKRDEPSQQPTSGQKKKTKNTLGAGRPKNSRKFELAAPAQATPTAADEKLHELADLCAGIVAHNERLEERIEDLESKKDELVEAVETLASMVTGSTLVFNPYDERVLEQVLKYL